jgi:deazaflavin-dependent oxidoreductase (nitroreductase family)
MLSMIIALVATIVAGLVSLGLVFVLGMRNKWPSVVDRVRRLNLNRLNPKQMETAGQPGAFAGIIRHTGRVSGTPYETPVGVFATEGGFVISLVYGERTQWLKNVLASAIAVIVHEGVSHDVDRPQVIPADEASVELSLSERVNHRVLGIDSVLQLHRVDRSDPSDVQ